MTEASKTLICAWHLLLVCACYLLSAHKNYRYGIFHRNGEDLGISLEIDFDILVLSVIYENFCFRG